tara:strand:- start:4995 stop:5879 length:885 start_codon:yes stop_codon:yes gene_type:complete
LEQIQFASILNGGGFLIQSIWEWYDMMKKQVWCAVLLGACGMAHAGISDFYVAGADGRIYSVDGASLAATEIYQIQGGMAINDIIFTGGNKMLANVTDQLIEYNMTTGTESVVFDIADYEGEDDVFFTSGFSGRQQGDIFMSVRRLGPELNDYIGAAFDPFTDSFTELADIQATVSGLFFDHQEIAPNRMLGADYGNESITLFNSASGHEIEVFDVEIGVVSFLELGSDLFLLDDLGGLYTFDSSTGATSLYGNLSGFQGSLLGAANTQVFRIPAPSSLAMLGFAGVICSHRRR